MIQAIVAGDIITSTRLSVDGKIFVEAQMQKLVRKLKRKYAVYARLIKGDYLECYVPKAKQALRVALLIKTYVKSIADYLPDDHNEQIKFFKMHGIRMAIGIGELQRLDLNRGIIDGDAIYYTGRILNEEKTYDKTRISIKNTLFIKTYDPALDAEFEPLLMLLDKLLEECTAKQSKVLYYKLGGRDEKWIAGKLQRSQPTINSHSTSAGWQAIEKAVNRFEHVLEEKLN